MKGAIPNEDIESVWSVNTPKSDMLYIVFVAVCPIGWRRLPASLFVAEKYDTFKMKV